jgi:O-methyltransferase
MKLRQLASTLYRKPSRLIDELQSNALMQCWLRQHGTGNGHPDRTQLFRSISDAIGTGTRLDYLEFGVYRGESIRNWVHLNTCPESRFWGFDTFEGLPEEWDQIRGEKPQGCFSTNGTAPAIPDARVRFIKGMFQKTLPAFLKTYTPGLPLVVHLDADLYTSTLYCLATLDPYLATGTCIMFDEFYSSSHEFLALYHYLSAFRRKAEVIGTVGAPSPVQLAIKLL